MKSCETCKFGKPRFTDDDIECRVNPPVMDDLGLAQWPIVKGASLGQWCGRWSPPIPVDNKPTDTRPSGEKADPGAYWEKGLCTICGYPLGDEDTPAHLDCLKEEAAQAADYADDRAVVRAADSTYWDNIQPVNRRPIRNVTANNIDRDSAGVGDG